MSTADFAAASSSVVVAFFCFAGETLSLFLKLAENY
jgi:hypothetical protein